jgi:hypothetical protein
MPMNGADEGNSEDSETTNEEETLNVFIGPAETGLICSNTSYKLHCSVVSPLHTDPRHNFFCQIRGRKFVRLISPKQRDCLYLYNDLMRQNTSQVCDFI